MSMYVYIYIGNLSPLEERCTKTLKLPIYIYLKLPMYIFYIIIHV